MDQDVDFPVYRSDANDPVEKDEKPTRRDERQQSHTRHKTSIIARRETEFRLMAEQKLAQASKTAEAQRKTLDTQTGRPIENPGQTIGM